MTKLEVALAVSIVLVTRSALAALEPPILTPVEQTRAWQAKRNKSLSDSTGWLALAGLFPLSHGQFSLGSGADNDIRFPPGAPSHIGRLRLTPAALHFEAAPDLDVRTGEAPAADLQLRSDEAEQGPTRLRLGPWSWWVIERVGRRWLRLSDAAHPALTDPAPIEFFAIDSAWRVSARLRLEPDAPPVAVPTVLGVPIMETAAGVLEFELDGRPYRLRALDRNGDLFLIFADLTSGTTTYGAGRFLWAEAPDEAGHTILDFNRAYNPPCAFTPFATCPLPPPGNRLDVAVRAGEKNWDGAPH